MSILDLNTDAALAARPRFVEQPKPQPKTSIWQDAAALATAIPRGVGEGVAQVGATVAEIMAGYGDTMARMESGQSLQDRAPNMQSDFADSLRDRGREFRPDALSATAAEQVLFGFARGAAKIVGGAVAGGAPGVVLAGVEEGYTQRGELIAEGVDPTTATKAGAVQGAGLALAALPVAGQTLRATAALYLAGGPGGFMAQQALTREILAGAGYADKAAASDPFDPVGLAVSAIVPLPFAVAGLRAAKLRTNLAGEIDAQAYTAPRAPEMTPTAQAVRAAFPREVEDAARVLADVQQRAAANPRPPSDLPAAAAHETALARAEEQMARGEPVQVADVAPRAVITGAERQANFRAWFGDSKVVDESGAPLVVYHGTAGDFDSFSADAIGSRNDPGKLGVGFYFTEHSGWANGYAGKADGANVAPVYLALRNPLVITTRGTGRTVWAELETLSRQFGIEDAPALVDRGMAPNPVWAAKFTDAVKAAGHDGVVLDYLAGQREFVAFDPRQIKSAIGNSGRFDPSSGSLTDPLTEFAANLRAAAAEIAKAEPPQPRAPAAPDAAAPAAETAPPQSRAPEAAAPDGAKPAPAAAAEAAATQPALTLAEQQFPDLMVQMDGMDKPVPAAELLRAVREQAARDQQDGELLAAAAQCAIVNGF